MQTCILRNGSSELLDREVTTHEAQEAASALARLVALFATNDTAWGGNTARGGSGCCSSVGGGGSDVRSSGGGIGGGSSGGIGGGCQSRRVLINSQPSQLREC
jgi:hypothetical protein